MTVFNDFPTCYATATQSLVWLIFRRGFEAIELWLYETHLYVTPCKLLQGAAAHSAATAINTGANVSKRFIRSFAVTNWRVFINNKNGNFFVLRHICQLDPPSTEKMML